MDEKLLDSKVGDALGMGSREMDYYPGKYVLRFDLCRLDFRLG